MYKEDKSFTRMRGTFVKGKFEGLGSLYSSISGNSFKGNYTNNKMNGNIKMYNKDNQLFCECVYNDGVADKKTTKNHKVQPI